MTAVPPPPSTPAPQYAPQPSTTNVWAIVSLITGLVGCLFITPLIAIVTGIIGIATAKPPKGGKGMAIAGIILGILWIGVGIGSYFAVYAGVQWVQTQVANLAKEPTMGFLNSLQEGNVDDVKREAGQLGEGKLQELAAQLKPLGKCQDITFASPSYQNNNGVVTVGFSGTAKFENGTRVLDVQLRDNNGQFVFEKLDIK